MDNLDLHRKVSDNMERLTYWKDKEHAVLDMNAENVRFATEKLADYEDAEEQGLLLRLPFKVGDIIYYISEGFIEPCTVEVIFLADYTDKNGNCSYMAEIHFDREDCPYVSTEIYFTELGKTVFFTKEEAERILKRMESEG